MKRKNRWKRGVASLNERSSNTLFVPGTAELSPDPPLSGTADAGPVGDHHYGSHFVAGPARRNASGGRHGRLLSKPGREADLPRVLSGFSSAPALEHAQTQLEEATSDQY